MKQIHAVGPLSSAVIEQGKKRAYQRPQLVVYGAVRQFTQGSIGQGSDAGNSRRDMTNSSQAYKINISQIDLHPLGFGLYLFDYKPEYAHFGTTERQFGVVAEEVAAVVPEAVGVDQDGYTVVDYTMLGIERSMIRVH